MNRRRPADYLAVAILCAAVVGWVALAWSIGEWRGVGQIVAIPVALSWAIVHVAGLLSR